VAALDTIGPFIVEWPRLTLADGGALSECAEASALLRVEHSVELSELE